MNSGIRATRPLWADNIIYNYPAGCGLFIRACWHRLRPAYDCAGIQYQIQPAEYSASASATYKICFKAVVQPGAVGGPERFLVHHVGRQPHQPAMGMLYFFQHLAFAASGDKKAGKSQQQFCQQRTDNPNTAVDWEITVRNTEPSPWITSW